MTAALAWQEWKQSLCPGGCGQPRDHGMTHGAEAYEVESVQCGACAARDIRAAAFAKNEDADSNGVFFAVVPREEADV